MATRAEDHGDHFLLNGRKLWITNASEAGFFLLFANANPEAGYKGVTAFLVEREFPGFQVGKKEDKLGGSPTPVRPASSCSSPTPTRRPATKESRLSWWSANFPVSKWARRKTSSVCAPPPPPT